MRVALQMVEMDRSCEIFILVCLMIYSNGVSAGLVVPKPDNLMVDIWDGEVTVLWEAPKSTPPKALYNVQFTKYGEEWADVVNCMRIAETHCEVTKLIDSYIPGYRVRVQLVTDHGVSQWTVIKRFLPNKSQLLPPSFTLLATSSTLTVKVHTRPILRKVFPYGVTYTIYLEERGQDNKTTAAYLRDDVLENKGAKTFSSLHWGTEYCVRLRVEGNGALSISNLSLEECLFLPEQEWYIIAVSSLSVLSVMGVLTILFTVTFYFLWRPEKTPVALKSPTSGWSPLTVREGPMEVVTDKGWFLQTIAENSVKNWVVVDIVTPQATIKEEEEGEDERRTSMDSGVSMKSICASKNRGSAPARQEDSGCGSLGGLESTASSRSGTGESPRQDGRTDINAARKREDSGMGLSCQLDCSGSLEGQDCGLLPEQVLGVGDGYHSQSPSSVRLHTDDGEETLKQILIEPQTILADVVTGYRSGHLACVCSGAGRCVWCQTTGHYGPKDDRQYRSLCITDGLLNGSNQIVDTCEEGEATFFSYQRKTHIQMETVVSMDDLETSPHMPSTELGGVFSLLTALSSLPPVVGVTNCSINTMPPSLSDVELTTD